MKVFKVERLIFLHGSDSSSQTYKATLLRQLYPGMVVPDFTGPLEERMKRLEEILGDANGWTIIGSSLGGTMAALFAARHPGQVRKLVLLAPALSLPEFAQEAEGRISIPCTIIQGTKDDVVPLEEIRKTAEKVFQNLKIIVVEDDHRLHRTAEELDWEELLTKE
jgi:pimeloyl-ACP methyl ester carboxylesterase